MMPLDYAHRWSQIALVELLKIEPGWCSGDELAWDVFKSREVIRGRTRAVLRQLAADGVLQRFDVRHRGGIMECYLLDHDAIRPYIHE